MSICDKYKKKKEEKSVTQEVKVYLYFIREQLFTEQFIPQFINYKNHLSMNVCKILPLIHALICIYKLTKTGRLHIYFRKLHTN